MTDMIFFTDGEEKFRIPFPTPGTKCPETKLEIKKMTTKAQQIIDVTMELTLRPKQNDRAKVIATALREVVEQYKVGNMIYCNDMLNLADELEQL